MFVLWLLLRSSGNTGILLVVDIDASVFLDDSLWLHKVLKIKHDLIPFLAEDRPGVDASPLSRTPNRLAPTFTVAEICLFVKNHPHHFPNIYNIIYSLVLYSFMFLNIYNLYKYNSNFHCTNYFHLICPFACF